MKQFNPAPGTFFKSRMGTNINEVLCVGTEHIFGRVIDTGEEALYTLEGDFVDVSGDALKQDLLMAKVKRAITQVIDRDMSIEAAAMLVISEVEVNGVGPISEIQAERERQREKYTDRRDDNRLPSELPRAAAMYALYGAWGADASNQAKDIIRQVAPWTIERESVLDRRRCLVKAAALIVAELERIDRQGAK